MFAPVFSWYSSLRTYRANRIADSIAPFVEMGETVLDCGCGHLLIGQRLQRRRGARVFGVDVMDFNLTALPLCLCQGEHLAFATAGVDLVCLIAVLHHADRPEALLRESLRVARRRVIVMEDVYRNAFEHALLKGLDWFGNRAISWDMSLPFRFRSEDEWLAMFADLGLRVAAIVSVRPLPWRPSRHRLFVLDKL